MTLSGQASWPGCICRCLFDVALAHPSGTDNGALSADQGDQANSDRNICNCHWRSHRRWCLGILGSKAIGSSHHLYACYGSHRERAMKRTSHNMFGCSVCCQTCPVILIAMLACKMQNLPVPDCGACFRVLYVNTAPGMDLFIGNQAKQQKADRNTMEVKASGPVPIIPIFAPRGHTRHRSCPSCT